MATAQAGLSAGSATLAGQKAGASADSASLASTKADEAGASAAASRADQISASAARDQALAALMAQGRQNLVARQNVPTAQAVAFGAGSLSGWGFSMVGTGTGSQERSITVGPLKRNTAYSVSILARRLAGSGSAPITCDFFPDTLPERTFDVQANAWTRFTWEGVTSASADMELSTVRLRFFRPNMATGLNRRDHRHQTGGRRDGDGLDAFGQGRALQRQRRRHLGGLGCRQRYGGRPEGGGCGRIGHDRRDPRGRSPDVSQSGLVRSV